MPPKRPAAQQERFIQLRESTGLSQEDAARRLGISTGTLSRKERGVSPVGQRDIDAMERLVREVELERLGEMVPRGTVDSVRERSMNDFVHGADELPRQLRIMAAEFEVEALKLGADEDEMTYVRTALQGPEAVRMFGMGYRETPKSAEQVQQQYAAHIDNLRLLIRDRIEWRRSMERRRP